MTPPNQTSRDRVLIVEDDPAVGQLLARILSYKDYDACVVTDGPSGVDAFQRGGCDGCVGCDDDCDGWDIVGCCDGCDGGGGASSRC